MPARVISSGWTKTAVKSRKATGGRIGYMHVPDTSFPGIIAFDKQFTAQLDKDGIIVDERYNSGGQILTSIPRNSAANFLPRLHRARGKTSPGRPWRSTGQK